MKVIKLFESKEDIKKFVDKFGQEAYDKFKKSTQRLKNNNISVDILFHVKNTSPEEMENILRNLENRAQVNDIKGNEIKGKYRYLGEKGGYKIYQPLDVEASMNLGVNTGWCTTGRYGHYGEPNFKPSLSHAESHWEDYADNNIKLFYFLDPKTMYGKYAIAIQNMPGVKEVLDKDPLLDTYALSFDYPNASTIAFYLESDDSLLGPSGYKVYNAEDEEVNNYSLINSLLQLAKTDKDFKEMYDKLGSASDFLIEADKNGLFIYNNILYGCKNNVKNLVVPNNVVGIVANACSDNDSLETVLINDSVKNVGHDAFSNCPNLKKVKFPKSLARIESSTFWNCISLEEIELPDNLSYIGDMAFLNTAIKSIKINNNVIISGYAFLKSGLKELSIGDNCKISYFSFKDSEDLKKVTIGNNCSISQDSFSNCDNIKEINISRSSLKGGKSLVDRSNEYYINNYLPYWGFTNIDKIKINII